MPSTATATSTLNAETVGAIPFDSGFPFVPAPGELAVQFGEQRANTSSVVHACFVPSPTGKEPVLDADRMLKTMQEVHPDDVFRVLFGPGSGLPDSGDPVHVDLVKSSPERCETLCKSIRPLSTPQVKDVLLATYAFAKVFADYCRLPFGQMPSVASSNELKPGTLGQFMFSKAGNLILLKDDLPVDVAAVTHFHELVHFQRNSVNPGVRFRAPVDEALTEALASNLWTRKFHDTGYEQLNSQLFAMHVVLNLQGGGALNSTGFRDGMNRMAKAMISGDREQLRAVSKANAATLNITEDIPDEQWQARIEALPPLKLQLDDGRIVDYRPTPPTPPSSDTQGTNAAEIAAGVGIGAAAGLALLATGIAAYKGYGKWKHSREERRDAVIDRTPQPQTTIEDVELTVVPSTQVDPTAGSPDPDR